jgi:predicted nucleic acid-binding protein
VFSALLDTSVLWPSTQRDFLLSLAAESVYRPLWSEAILEELEEHEAEKLVSRGRADAATAARRAARLVAEMRGAFDDASVIGWEGLEGTYGLPDPDDEHVVAAAVVGNAGAIVTANLRHFPQRLMPTGMEVLPVQDFLCSQVALNPQAGVRAVREIAARSGQCGPSRTAVDILNHLETTYRLIDTVALMRPRIEGADEARPVAGGDVGVL